MLNNYVGKNPYDESILVRCDCGMHFMEIYTINIQTNYTILGINWHSPMLRKCKYPDFEFMCYDDFKQFKKAISTFVENPTPYEQPLVYGTVVNLKNNKVKFNGSLMVNMDEYEYLNFTRFDKYNRCVWDLCIRKENISDLVSELDKIEKEYLKFKDPFFTD